MGRGPIGLALHSVAPIALGPIGLALRAVALLGIELGPRALVRTLAVRSWAERVLDFRVSAARQQGSVWRLDSGSAW